MGAVKLSSEAQRTSKHHHSESNLSEEKRDQGQTIAYPTGTPSKSWKPRADKNGALSEEKKRPKHPLP